MAQETVDNAWPVMEKIGLHPDASLDRLRIAESLETMAASVDLIQESAPGRLELKTELHRRIDQAADPVVVIASSTSGLLPSEYWLVSLSTQFICSRWWRLWQVNAPPRRALIESSRSTLILECTHCGCGKKCRDFFLTGYGKRYGEKHCTWSTTVSQRPKNWMPRFPLGPGCAGHCGAPA